MSNWYQTKTSGGQGLVACEETGRNVAVCYDAKDAPIIAAAPAMLQALRNVASCPAAMRALRLMGQIEGDGCQYAREIDSAIALATGNPTGETESPTCDTEGGE